MKNSFLVADLRPPIPPFPSKTPPLPPPPVPTPAPTIAAASDVRTIAVAFPALSTKVQLKSTLTRKWKPLIYSSDSTSLEGIYNGSYL